MSQSDLVWASCPITQNGFIGIISQTAYPGSISTSQAFSLLGNAATSPRHRFWPDDASPLDNSLIDPNFVHGPKQATDIYLLALAIKHNGRLVALDRAIPLNAVLGAEPRHLVLLRYVATQLGCNSNQVGSLTEYCIINILDSRTATTLMILMRGRPSSAAKAKPSREYIGTPRSK